MAIPETPDLRRLLASSWRSRRAPLDERLRRRRPDPAIARPEARDRQRRVGPFERLRRRAFGNLLADVERLGLGELAEPEAARGEVRRVLAELGDTEALSVDDRRRLEDELVAEVCGFGPLDRLFADPTVSDILVNGPGEVWVDRFGRLEPTELRFDDSDHLMRLLGRLVAAHGRRLDEASPSVDVRLPGGSRLHAIIPPLSAAPVVSIRRLRVVPFRPEELCDCGTLSPEMTAFLAAVMAGRLNVVISGGAASGKTTLLNVLTRFIPPGERVVTIEETAELELAHPHVVALEARLPNIEGRGEVTLRHLVRNALRMRPDRIIVGEVRGPEVFDMLQAMNTGHEGSLTTVHANSPEDALRRIENLVLMGGFGLPSRAIRELLGATLHVMVHLQRFLDGTRRVTSVREVLWQGDGVSTRELFRFEPAAGQAGGRHQACGATPSFLPRLELAGFDAALLAGGGTASGGAG